MLLQQFRRLPQPSQWMPFVRTKQIIRHCGRMCINQLINVRVPIAQTKCCSMKDYKDVEMFAKNAPTGSYAAGCPVKGIREYDPDCKNCEHAS